MKYFIKTSVCTALILSMMSGCSLISDEFFVELKTELAFNTASSIIDEVRGETLQWVFNEKQVDQSKDDDHEALLKKDHEINVLTSHCKDKLEEALTKKDFDFIDYRGVLVKETEIKLEPFKNCVRKLAYDTELPYILQNKFLTLNEITLYKDHQKVRELLNTIKEDQKITFRESSKLIQTIKNIKREQILQKNKELLDAL